MWMFSFMESQEEEQIANFCIWIGQQIVSSVRK